MDPQAGSDDLVQHALVPVSQRDISLILESGYLFMELGKHREAEEIFLGAAALVPKSEAPHMALGNLHFAQGHFSPALKCHQQGLALNPASATAHASCAESLFFLKREAEALEHLERALATPDDGPAHAFANALKEAHELGIFKA